MASAFGHAAAAFALSHTGILKKTNWKLLLIGIAVSILPDADVLGFYYGVPYNSFWGHRGFSHSIVFAAFVALVLTGIVYARPAFGAPGWWGAFFFLFLSCISHALLDALTTGGLGVAFFAPFNNKRYFFPYRPIKVSPLSLSGFINGSGWTVIKSEFVWIGIPTLVVVGSSFAVKKLRGEKEQAKPLPD